MDDIDLTYKPPELVDFKCKCTKSHCLKMYCECFTSGYYCDSNCGCVGCHNQEATQEKIRNARVKIKTRNKNAFKDKVKPIIASDKVVENLEGEKQQLKAEQEFGCNCKKSNCLKGYCECFNIGLPCKPGKCKCVDCFNDKIRSSAFNYN